LEPLAAGGLGGGAPQKENKLKGLSRMLINDFWSQAAEGIYFGPYPTQSIINKILATYPDILIVNLTQDVEIIEGYSAPASHLLSYPIKDNNIPLGADFAPFIARIARCERLFIHCKGGHGRSSMVAACVLCYKFKYEPEKALGIVMRAHRERNILSQRWREKALCMRLCQRNFVYDSFLPIYIKRVYKRGSYNGLNACSLYPILYGGIKFQCAEILFQALKDFENKDYVDKLLAINPRFVYLAKNIGEEHYIAAEEDWIERRHEIMKFVYSLKLQQHPYIKEYLLSTRLAPIIDISRNRHYDNLIGCVLSELRDEFLSLCG